jgi:hypothetical protein
VCFLRPKFSKALREKKENEKTETLAQLYYQRVKPILNEVHLTHFITMVNELNHYNEWIKYRGTSMFSPSALQPFSPSTDSSAVQSEHHLNQPLFEKALLLANSDSDTNPRNPTLFGGKSVYDRCRQLKEDFNNDINKANQRNISRDDKQHFLNSARGNIDLMNSDYCRKPNGETVFTGSDIRSMKDDLASAENSQFSDMIAQLKPHFESGKQWVMDKAAQGVDKATAFANWIKSKDMGQKAAILLAVGALIVAEKIPSPQGKTAAGVLAVVAAGFGMTMSELSAGVKKVMS